MVEKCPVDFLELAKKVMEKMTLYKAYKRKGKHG